jgi:hypothetical protein
MAANEYETTIPHLTKHMQTLFAWVISHSWKYCLLICCEKKIMLNNWQVSSSKSGSLALGRFSSQKILQNFLNSPSHRIFRHMHEVLNIDKK